MMLTWPVECQVDGAEAGESHEADQTPRVGPLLLFGDPDNDKKYVHEAEKTEQLKHKKRSIKSSQC